MNYFNKEIQDIEKELETNIENRIKRCRNNKKEGKIWV